MDLSSWHARSNPWRKKPTTMISITFGHQMKFKESWVKRGDVCSCSFGSRRLKRERSRLSFQPLNYLKNNAENKLQALTFNRIHVPIMLFENATMTPKRKQTRGSVLLNVNYSLTKKGKFSFLVHACPHTPVTNLSVVNN